ncbi:hypothetical protein B0H14DRAFT_2600741 [Mycena olivaceomarginata]|nr:hypothetical protein B0H14DRAFT_2600741 [Mycena olivaceomarginata]
MERRRAESIKIDREASKGVTGLKPHELADGSRRGIGDGGGRRRGGRGPDDLFAHGRLNLLEGHQRWVNPSRRSLGGSETQNVTAALTREIAEDPRKRAGDSFENY